MRIWTHTVTRLEDYVSDWLASVLPLHLLYMLDACEAGVILKEADPRIKPHHTADGDIWGCPSADLSSCAACSSKIPLSCSLKDGAESHGQSDLVEPPCLVQLTGPCEDPAGQDGKIFVHISSTTENSDGSVHSSRSSEGLSATLSLASPALFGSSLRSCLKNPASSSRLSGRVRFAHEIQFWFPGSEQLSLSRFGSIPCCSPSAFPAGSDRHVGLHLPEPSHGSQGWASSVQSVRHVGLRPPDIATPTSPPPSPAHFHGSTCRTFVDSQPRFDADLLPLEGSGTSKDESAGARHVGLRPPDTTTLALPSELPGDGSFDIFIDPDCSISMPSSGPFKGGSCRTLADSHPQVGVNSPPFVAPWLPQVEPVHTCRVLADITNLSIQEVLPFSPDFEACVSSKAEHVGFRSPVIFAPPELRGYGHSVSSLRPAFVSNGSDAPEALSFSGWSCPRPLLCPRKTSSARPKARFQRGRAVVSSGPSPVPGVPDASVTGRRQSNLQVASAAALAPASSHFTSFDSVRQSSLTGAPTSAFFMPSLLRIFPILLVALFRTPLKVFRNHRHLCLAMLCV